MPVPEVSVLERVDCILSTPSRESVPLFTGMRERSIGNRWFAGDVTAAMLVVMKHFFPLRTTTHFQVNSSKRALLY